MVFFFVSYPYVARRQIWLLIYRIRTDAWKTGAAFPVTQPGAPTAQPQIQQPAVPTSHRGPSKWLYSCGLCQQDHSLYSSPVSRDRPRFRGMRRWKDVVIVETVWQGAILPPIAPVLMAADVATAGTIRPCTGHRSWMRCHEQMEAINAPAFAWDLILVPTVMIRLMAEGMEGFVMVRALMSQSATMTTISYAAYAAPQRITTFTIRPRRISSSWSLQVNAVVRDKLPRRLYSEALLEDSTRGFTNYAIAGPDPRGNTPIDVELGADTYNAIRKSGCVAVGLTEPEHACCRKLTLSFNTQLGIVFAGQIRNMAAAENCMEQVELKIYTYHSGPRNVY
ncbi:uncharacterized protein LOC131806654 [Musca domestica]|uniref:Uncharacterized protein LOC131805073 n=1 Tax=Musca domestica TaxID=7370 RepID=A0ABM3VF41_MUSDO|nr:uncharacterized protein LOC131805073 [Musca domestica]XP_058987176.1 uncharacterized protein LOC131806654 [Musca domestica]